MPNGTLRTSPRVYDAIRIMNKIRAYFELVRLPNAFTAVADILAGFWLVRGALEWSWQLAALVTASATLYVAGIVFNDLRDIEIDRGERPHRPLPSGRIDRRHALRLAVVLSILGVTLATIAGFIGDGIVEGATGVPVEYRPGLVAVGLLAAILAYDFVFKGTPFGPLSMGLCRGLNLLMAMSVGWMFQLDLGLLVIIALVHYTASLTYFGFEETRRSPRFRLVTGGFGIILAILLLGVFAVRNESGADITLILWFAFLVHLARVATRTTRKPSAAQVQYAMKTFILGFIVFDAIVASASAGWEAGTLVLALLAPSLLLGRWIYST